MMMQKRNHSPQVSVPSNNFQPFPERGHRRRFPSNKGTTFESLSTTQSSKIQIQIICHYNNLSVKT